MRTVEARDVKLLSMGRLTAMSGNLTDNPIYVTLEVGGETVQLNIHGTKDELMILAGQLRNYVDTALHGLSGSEY